MVDYSDIVYKCLEINTFYCEKDNNGNSVIYLKSPNCIHNVGDILHFADGINCSNASYDTVLEILSTVEFKGDYLVYSYIYIYIYIYIYMSCPVLSCHAFLRPKRSHHGTTMKSLTIMTNISNLKEIYFIQEANMIN